MSDGEKKAEIAYIADGPAGMKLKGDDDRWYNPVNEEVRSHVKADLRVGDKVLIKYQEVPDSDDKRQVVSVNKVDDDASKTSNKSSDKPQAFQQPSQDKNAKEQDISNSDDSRWEKSDGSPRVQMPTRHGALNTAIESLKLESEAGRKLPSSSERIRELIEERADEFIQYIYSGSKQEWKDDKVKDNHE